MQAPKFHQSRLNFQFERFLFFSDGFMAICITLMVLDIRVPQFVMENGIQKAIFTDAILLKELSKMTFKFLGYLISFGIIGHYWSVHHRIFGYVIKYDTQLIWWNLGYLFMVALLPFSSGLLGEYSTRDKMHLHLPYLVYVINICLVAYFNVAMWLYVSKPSRQFLTHEISSFRIKLGVYRSLILPAVFVFSYLVSFVSPIIARFIPLTIPLIIHYGMKGIENKMIENENLMEKAVVENEGELTPPSTV
jgi:uncharacterized membrane protein